MDKNEKICKKIGIEVKVEYNKCPICGGYSEQINKVPNLGISVSRGEWYAKFKCTRCNKIWYVECIDYVEKIKFAPPKVVEIPISELRPPRELLKILKDGQ